jgi:hypothetical protein
MKPFFAILLLMIGVCVACASRSTSSQSPQNSTALPSPSPTETTNAAVSNKSPCSLVIDQAPVINGIRLGMTPVQVLALFPGSREDAEVSASVSAIRPFGVSSFMIKPDKYESKEKFAGINHITFRLLDGRVSNLRVGYNGPEFSHVDKFVAKFTEGTNLPSADAWEPYVGMDTSLKILKCTGFEIQVFTGGPGGNLNYVEMRDLEADKTLKDRKAKARQKATP